MRCETACCRWPALVSLALLLFLLAARSPELGPTATGRPEGEQVPPLSPAHFILHSQPLD